MPDAGWMRVERNGEVTGFVSDGCEWSTVSLEENAAAKSRANANVDLPDTAAQDSASKSNNPAVSG
jgi:hypothetical protein